jgi:hypothetical protein
VRQYQTERYAPTLLRIDVYDNPAFRAWSIAVNTSKGNPFVESMFLPDHSGPVDQRVMYHPDLSAALRFIGCDDISAIVNGLSEDFSFKRENTKQLIPCY